MKHSYRVIIGYFPTGMDLRKVALFLKRRSHNIRQFETGSRLVGFNGTVGYLVAWLDSEAEAQKAARALDGMAYRNHRLTTWTCKERTSANERRSVGWRESTWTGLERRRGDRRRYSRHSVQDSVDAPCFFSDPTPDPGYIAYSQTEAEAYLGQSIRHKTAPKPAKDGGNRLKPAEYWSHDEHI